MLKCGVPLEYNYELIILNFPYQVNKQSFKHSRIHINPHSSSHLNTFNHDKDKQNDYLTYMCR